jgi:hypothetical protein
MATTFVIHAITLVTGAVVVVVVALVVVVVVVAVNHCRALHSQPYSPLTDLKTSHIFKIILYRLATIFQVKFLKVTKYS